MKLALKIQYNIVLLKGFVVVVSQKFRKALWLMMEKISFLKSLFRNKMNSQEKRMAVTKSESEYQIA